MKKYPCPRCKQLFATNPEDPPPPHNKPNSSEVCYSEQEWRDDQGLDDD